MDTRPSGAGRWSDELLDGKRGLGDPTADELIEKLFAEREAVDAVAARPAGAARLFETLVGSESPLGSELPDSVLRFLTSTPLPPWADMARILRGQELFERYAPLVVISLFCCSLPRAYLARKGVQVLNLTAFLSRDPRRRVIETAQMLIDVLTPGGLERPASFGRSSAQKVRMMHAAIRFLIQRRLPWDAADLGVPINQEDLAGTLCTFSVGVLQGLGRFGVELSTDEAEDYLHTWKVIGNLLGVDDDLLPRDVADATALAERIAERHFEASPEGRHMAAALVELMKELTPARFLDGLPISTVRFLIGDEPANLLGVPPADWTRHAIPVMRMLGRAFDRWSDESKRHQWLGRLFGSALLSGLMAMERGPKRARIRVPTDLDWYLRPSRREPGNRFVRFLHAAWRTARTRLLGWWKQARARG